MASEERTLLPDQGLAELPMPNASGLDHVVVVTMENRSFDHFLGWLPAADGRQAGLTYLDSTGVKQQTHHLADNYQGCGYRNLNNSYHGARIAYNNGECNGWLQASTDNTYAIAYYTDSDLPFFGQAARHWTVCDRYFAAIMAETYPNRLYLHAAQTDRLDDTAFPLTTLPTIWDRLQAARLDGRYYFSDLPFLLLWGSTYLKRGICHPIDRFFADCATGRLPHVSYVEPRFLGEFLGMSGDDHPPSDIRNGEAFLYRIYEAVTKSPAWPHTLLVITFDESGGFFDHVPPPLASSIPEADRVAGNVDGRLGFRVPTLLIAPWARRGFIAHEDYDHTSILKLIEWRWNLEPLTVRDKHANNLAAALDFNHPNLHAPRFAVPAEPFGRPCLPLGAVHGLEGAAFRAHIQDTWPALPAHVGPAGPPTASPLLPRVISWIRSRTRAFLNGLKSQIAIFILVWIAGLPVFWVGVPSLLASILRTSANFPVSARAALCFAWLAFMLFSVGLVNFAFLIRAGKAPITLAVPPSWTSWIVGIAALAVGVLIGTTVFT